MKQIILPSLCVVLMGIGITAQAQNPRPQSPPSQQREPDDAQSVTLTGCLTKGAASGEYVLADQKSGEKVQFAASEKIEPFVNQTVQLTGRKISQGGDTQFQPESVKRVSSSCESPAPR